MRSGVRGRSISEVNVMWKIILYAALAIFVAIVALVGYVLVTDRPLPQNEHDAAIIERTLELLANEADWSKRDTRECPAGQTRLSLYCALRQASQEVTGGFEHRAAALQQVRYAIGRARPDADYAHRLMDYNNDPGVRLADVHAMLNEALENLRANVE